MKLSRFWGAAFTCGALLGGGNAYSQVPYYNAAHPSLGYSNQLSAVAPQQYPSVPTYYPTTGAQSYQTPVANGYSFVSATPAMTQFAGPANQASRLPGSNPNAVVSMPTQNMYTGPIQQTAPVSSVMTTPIGADNGPGQVPPYGSGVPGAGLQGQVQGEAATGGIHGGVQGGGVQGGGTFGGGTYGSGSVGSGNSAGGIYDGGIYGGGVHGGVYGGGAGMGYNGGAGSIQAPGMAGYGGGTANGSCQPGLQPFCGNDACGYVGPNRWYVGAYGLLLNRDRQEHFTFSFDTGNEAIQFTDAKDAHVGWGGGFATVIGHYFNCGACAVEGVYWGWYPDDGSSFTYAPSAIGDLNGIFNWDSLTYNGLNMGAFVNDAEVHALFRQNEAHNVEINVLSFSNTAGENSSLRFTTLAGFRYFRFSDQLTFRSDPDDRFFSGEIDEVYYDIQTLNRLIGFQVGGVGTYCVGPRLSLNAGTKIGFFGNHISHSSQIGGAAGTAVINNGPNAGRDFFVSNTKNDVSFLSEVFAGFGYNISPRWTASAGYRAIAITGLALPTDQIYPDLRGINDLDTIESQGSLILHGAYFGAQFCF